MVRVPSDPVVIPVAMFPEPDHAPELEAQVAYEVTRDGDAWAGVDDVPAPALGQIARESAEAHWPVGTTVEFTQENTHTGPRTCNQPSHAEWFVARHPEYLSRDDAHG